MISRRDVVVSVMPERLALILKISSGIRVDVVKSDFLLLLFVMATNLLSHLVSHSTGYAKFGVDLMARLYNILGLPGHSSHI